MLRTLLLLAGMFGLLWGFMYARIKANDANRPQRTSRVIRKSTEEAIRMVKLREKAIGLEAVAKKKGYSTRYGFLIDMSMPSGKRRFFIYDMQGDSVLHSGLVAHGSCNQSFRRTPYFSNKPNTGCSSEGLYKVGYTYNGRFGKSYKLYGLDSSNSNAFKRAIVLHAYDCVPDEEVYPLSLCNSLGCPMVSYNFRDTLASYIDRSEKPILMWIVPDIRR